MKIKSKITLGVVSFLFLLAPIVTANAATGSQVTITSAGAATIVNATVMQIAGNTFYTRLYWGQSFVRVLVETNSATTFFRGTGEASDVSEVSTGDLLNLSGALQSGSDSLVLVANTITDTSVQKEQTTTSGTVTAVNLSAGSFVMNSKDFGSITIAATANTQFIKGPRILDLAHVQVGDTITKVVGDYDLNQKILTAVSVTTYIDPNFYNPQNFQGTLVSLAGTSLPTSIQVTIGNVTYTVMLTQTSYIWNYNRNSVLLSRFVAGDTVRLYGAIRQQDAPVIDASILRDLNL